MGDLDLGSALVNFSGDFPSIVAMVIALAKPFGLIMVAHAVMKIAQHNQMHGNQGGMGDSILELFIGAMMINMPTIASAVWESLYGAAGRTTYESISYPMGQGTPAHVQTTMNAILGFVSVVGWFGFFRGLALLKKMGDHINSSQHDEMMRSLLFLVAGALAINIEGTLDMIKGSFGIA